MPIELSELQMTVAGAGNPMVVACKIFIDGEELEPSLPLVRVLVDREVGRIPSATLTFVDGDVSQQDFRLSNRDTFAPGQGIEIRFGYRNNPEKVFRGIIVGHANSISGSQSELTVTCRDAAVRMTLEKRNAHYTDITDSDVAQQLIAAYDGLTADIESTQVVHENLAQYGLSDWDFLLYRFDLLGMFCTVDDGIIEIRKPDLQKRRVADIVYGATLIEYSAEIDARSQSGTVTATAWDYSLQEMTASTGAEPSLQMAGNLPPAELAAAAGFDTEDLRYTGKWTAAELQALADARLQKRRLARVRGRVRFQGTALVKPNEFIAVGGIGERFSGPLYVAGVQQRYEGGSWDTEVQFGMDAEWFAEKINPWHPTAAQGIVPAVQGLHIGLVSDIEDPGGEFRVRVKLPAIQPAEEGIWARLATLDAGNGRGTFFRPEVGDEVIVGFLGDDPRQAVILGMLHSSAKAAPLQPAAANNEKGYVSRSDFRLLFNDEDKSLTIRSPAGRQLVIHDGDGSIVLEDENKNRIRMDSSGITIEAAAALTLKAGSEVKIEAPSININGSGTTVIKGGMVQIN